jgi:hypothetical protein
MKRGKMLGELAEQMFAVCGVVVLFTLLCQVPLVTHSIVKVSGSFGS